MAKRRSLTEISSEKPPKLFNRYTGKPDGRCRDWKPVDPVVIAFAAKLRPNHSERTLREYVRDVEIFGAFLQERQIVNEDGSLYRGPFGEILIKAPEVAVDRFILSLMEVEYSVAGIRRKLAVLRRFYKFVMKEGLRSDNPAIDVENVKLPHRLAKSIPEKDVMQLISTRPEAGQPELRWRRDFAILELLYASGIRRAELVGINVRDVDFSTRQIKVIGKGNKERIAFFNRSTSMALKAYLRVRPRCQDGALFVSRQGRRLSYQQVGRIFAGYVALSGLEGKITPHTMRHSAATHLHAHGVDLLTIRDFLGHASVQTTQIYTELTQTQVQRKVDEFHPRDRLAKGGSRSKKNFTEDE